MKLLLLVFLFSASAFSAEVISILRSGVRANPTNAANVEFTVRFSQPVFNVQPTDFRLRATGSLRSGQIVDVRTTNDISFKVDVRYFRGEGGLRLILQDSDRSIVDSQNKPLTRSVFTTGQSWDVDNVGPRALSMYKVGTFPGAVSRYVDRYMIRFSESVYGVGVYNFFASGNGVYVRSVFGSGSIRYIDVVKKNRNDFTYLYFRDPSRSIRDRLGNRRRN